MSELKALKLRRAVYCMGCLISWWAIYSTSGYSRRRVLHGMLSNNFHGYQTTFMALKLLSWLSIIRPVLHGLLSIIRPVLHGMPDFVVGDIQYRDLIIAHRNNDNRAASFQGGNL